MLYLRARGAPQVEHGRVGKYVAEEGSFSNDAPCHVHPSSNAGLTQEPGTSRQFTSYTWVLCVLRDVLVQPDLRVRQLFDDGPVGQHEDHLCYGPPDGAGVRRAVREEVGGVPARRAIYGTPYPLRQRRESTMMVIKREALTFRLFRFFQPFSAA